MMGYESKSKLYTVKVTDNEWIGAKNTVYAVPRIRLLFMAEDPNIFVARVKEAFEMRKKTEELIRYERNKLKMLPFTDFSFK